MSSKAYVYDRSSNSWITGEQAGVITPSGLISPFAGVNQPAGWLFCFGQTLNAVTSPQFQSLYNSIGNAYGGTNNSNFVVPDLRGRAAFGKGNMGGTSTGWITNYGPDNSGIDANILGNKGGSQRAHKHAHGAYSVGETQEHQHEMHTAANPGSGGPAVRFDYNYDSSGGFGYPQGIYGGGRSAQHSHGIGVYESLSGESQNMPPAIILNYIIKI
jgi:microcystin-dependent protein